jgi:hypothetical protein
MAKKVVASLQKGADKTGAYSFEEGIVPNEMVQEYFKK